MYEHILTLKTNWGYMDEDNQTGRKLQTYINKTKTQEINKGQSNASGQVFFSHLTKLSEQTNKPDTVS